MDVAEIHKEAKSQMQKALENLHREMASIRTGRATPTLLDRVRVNVYGQSMPLNAVSTISVAQAKTLVVTVWDANNVKAVDAAIRQSDLNFNPRIDGNKLFVILPDLSAERRQELIKIGARKAEETKVSIRNIRRQANEELKSLEQEKKIPEDELKENLNDIQKLTDQFVAEVETSFLKKKQELEIL